MPALTKKFFDDNEALAIAALQGQSTYTGSGAHAADIVVIAGSHVKGVNSITFASGGGAATNAAVETPIGSTRATTETWTWIVAFRVDAGATNLKAFSARLTKGAVDLAAFTTDALAMAPLRNGANVDLQVVDNAGLTTLASVATTGQVVLVKCTALGDAVSGNVVIAEISADGTGNVWAPLNGGVPFTLKAGNEAFDRWDYQFTGGVYASNTNFFDNVGLMLMGNPNQPLTGVRPQRLGKVTLTTINAPAPGLATLTIQVIDLNSGAVLDTRPKVIPLNRLTATTADVAIQQAIRQELELYDQEQQAAAINTSGYEVIQ